MPVLAQDEDLLHVGTLRLDYHVSGDAHATRARLDRMPERGLRRHLHEVFAPARDAGEGLWFIRRLDMEADIDLELDDREIMRNWSRRFARALQRRLLEGACAEVVHFPDYPAYLASFVADLAGGSGGKAWYFRTPEAEFAGVRALPVPQAIVTVLLRAAATGQRALLGLTRADRARVLLATGDAGARRLLDVLAHAVPAATFDAAELLSALLAQLSDPTGIPLLVSEQPWLETLDLYLRAIEHRPAQAGVPLAALALATVTLRRQAQTRDAVDYRRLARAVEDADHGAVVRALPGTAAQRLLPLNDLRRRDRRRLLHALQPENAAPAADANAGAARYSPFGGVFLLLGPLQELPLGQWLADWPEPPAGGRDAALRLLLLTQCLGAELAGRVFRDPLVRELAGAPPALTAAGVREWLDSVAPARVRAVQRAYAHWRLAQCGADRVEVSHWPFAGRRLAIAGEARRGCWLLLRGCQPHRPARLRRRLEAILPDGCAWRWSVAGEQASPRPDLTYLQLPHDLRPAGGARWLLAAISQGMLRDLAWRLPGFAGSSPGHIRDNFLGLDACLEAEPGRWLVRLGRPPLNVVLAMTGLARGRHAPDWLDDCRIELHQGE